MRSHSHTHIDRVQVKRIIDTVWKWVRRENGKCERTSYVLGNLIQTKNSNYVFYASTVGLLHTFNVNLAYHYVRYIYIYIPMTIVYVENITHSCIYAIEIIWLFLKTEKSQWDEGHKQYTSHNTHHTVYCSKYWLTIRSFVHIAHWNENTIGGSDGNVEMPMVRSWWWWNENGDWIYRKYYVKEFMTNIPDVSLLIIIIFRWILLKISIIFVFVFFCWFKSFFHFLWADLFLIF